MPLSATESPSTSTSPSSSNTSTPPSSNHTSTPPSTSSTPTSSSTSSKDGKPMSTCNSNSFQNSSDPETQTSTEEQTFKFDFKCNLVLLIVCFGLLSSAIEGTVGGVVLPKVSSELRLGYNYTWASMLFLIVSTAVQPLWTQLQDTLGRKIPLQAAFVFFAIGSCCCGWATNGATFLVGRAFQGMGTSGIDVISETIIGDIIPLRKLPLVFGIKQGVYAAGCLLGPSLGGWLTEEHTWRAVFWLNIPLCGISLLLITLWLNIPNPSTGTLRQKLIESLKMDFLGMGLFSVSLVLAMISLSDRDVLGNPTSIGLFVAAVVGVIGFLAWEIKWCPNPIMAGCLWRKLRTSVIGLLNICIWGAVAYGIQLALPIYLQAVEGNSPNKTGIKMLPITSGLVVLSCIAGPVMSRLGHIKGIYMWAQLGGFLILTVAVAIATMLGQSSPHGLIWAVMILGALGAGVALPAILPSVKIELDDTENGPATGNWSILRSVGAVVGAVLPAICINMQTRKLLGSITDEDVHQKLLDEGLWNLASAEAMDKMSVEVRHVLRATFASGLRRAYVIMAICTGVAAIASLGLKRLVMRDKLSTGPESTTESESR